jgi:hypothetical protein
VSALIAMCRSLRLFTGQLGYRSPRDVDAGNASQHHGRRIEKAVTGFPLRLMKRTANKQRPLMNAGRSELRPLTIILGKESRLGKKLATGRRVSRRLFDVPAARDHPRIRAVAYYFQSIEDPFEFSVGQQRQAIQAWATEHDIEILREFSQLGYRVNSQSQLARDTERLCQPSDLAMVRLRIPPASSFVASDYDAGFSCRSHLFKTSINACGNTGLLT